jgi:hypothetical protein
MQMSLVSLSGHLESVRCQPVFLVIDCHLDDQRLSFLSSSNRVSSSGFSQRSQKGVHDLRRKTQPGEACQLCRNRMFCSRRVSRKFAHRYKGKFNNYLIDPSAFRTYLNLSRTSSDPLSRHSSCNLLYSLRQHGLASMCSILMRSLHVKPPGLH